MFKEVTIGKKKVALLANGATPLYYKQVFKKDIIKQFNDAPDELQAVTDSAPELAYIMAKQAENQNEIAKMSTLNFESYIAWISELNPLDIPMAADAIIAVYMGDQVPDSEPKKNKNVDQKE